MKVTVVMVEVATAGWRNSIHAPCVSAGMRKRLRMRARSHAGQSEARGTGDARWEDRDDWQMTEPRARPRGGERDPRRSRCVQFACVRASETREAAGKIREEDTRSSVPSVVQREAFE